MAQIIHSRYQSWFMVKKSMKSKRSSKIATLDEKGNT